MTRILYKAITLHFFHILIPNSLLQSHLLSSHSATMSSVSKILFISLSVCLVAVGTLSACSLAARAFFVFGDSLVDNGNNNYLATTARADSPPYGIDYPTHRPTGRFSNGLNIPDIISYVSQYNAVWQ